MLRVTVIKELGKLAQLENVGTRVAQIEIFKLVVSQAERWRQLESARRRFNRGKGGLLPSQGPDVDAPYWAISFEKSSLR